jgi:hypothetical protein
LFRGKSSPRICAISAIFRKNVLLKKLLKENNRPEGENSPYLVTLVAFAQQSF